MRRSKRLSLFPPSLPLFPPPPFSLLLSKDVAAAAAAAAAAAGVVGDGAARYQRRSLSSFSHQRCCRWGQQNSHYNSVCSVLPPRSAGRRSSECNDLFSSPLPLPTLSSLPSTKLASLLTVPAIVRRKKNGRSFAPQPAAAFQVEVATSCIALEQELQEDTSRKAAIVKKILFLLVVVILLRNPLIANLFPDICATANRCFLTLRRATACVFVTSAFALGRWAILFSDNSAHQSWL